MDGIRGGIEQLLDTADAEELELVLIFLESYFRGKKRKKES